MLFPLDHNAHAEHTSRSHWNGMEMQSNSLTGARWFQTEMFGFAIVLGEVWAFYSTVENSLGNFMLNSFDSHK